MQVGLLIRVLRKSSTHTVLKMALLAKDIILPQTDTSAFREQHLQRVMDLLPVMNILPLGNMESMVSYRMK